MQMHLKVTRTMGNDDDVIVSRRLNGLEIWWFWGASILHQCFISSHWSVYLFAFAGRCYTDSFAYMVLWFISDCETFRETMDESNLKPVLPTEL